MSGFLIFLTIVFVVLKLCGLLAFSWLWVFCPLWIPVGVVLVWVAFLCVLSFMAMLFD